MRHLTLLGLLVTFALSSFAEEAAKPATEAPKAETNKEATQAKKKRTPAPKKTEETQPEAAKQDMGSNN